jgi:hypothetical protein
VRTPRNILISGLTSCLRLAAMAALAVPAGAEDLTIVSKTRFGEKEGRQTVFLTPTRMLTKSGGAASIVEFESGQMTFLDEAKKTYYLSSVEEMAAYAKRREEQAKTSRFNEQAFGALGEVTARKMGKSRKIAGYACEGWVVALGEALVFELCAAPELAVPPAYFNARRAAYAGMGPMGRHFEKMFEAMRKIPGYPLSLAMRIKTEGMKQETLYEATEVTKGAIPPGTFAVPADYRKKKSPFAP